MLNDVRYSEQRLIRRGELIVRNMQNLPRWSYATCRDEMAPVGMNMNNDEESAKGQSRRE